MNTQQYTDTILAKAAVDVQAFVDYVLKFYGKGGLYGLDVTEYETRAALIQLLESKPEHEFVGDTWDRELVCGLIMAERAKAAERFAEASERAVAAMSDLDLY